MNGDAQRSKRDVVGGGVADDCDHGGELSSAAVALHEFFAISVGICVLASGDCRADRNGVVSSEAQRAKRIPLFMYVLIGHADERRIQPVSRVLPASTNPAFALTVDNAKAPVHGLRVGVVGWPIGMALVAAYSIYSCRSFAGKVKLPSAEESC
jgi:hypothetical protein